MTPDEKRKVAQLVAGIVVTDDVLDPSEERFVDKMLDELGIPSDERAVIFPILDGDEAAEALARMSPALQEEVLGLLIQAAAADGQIVEEERAYLEAVARAAGIDEAGLVERLDAALPN
ncbi:MAG: TerB family tellurite resistance protein [Myxococcales bacterium]|nr:TerB family tellurite resistance protein [Myxococcales bacterium]